MKSLSTFAAAATLLFAAPASAAVIVSIDEVGADVVMVVSGTLDVTGHLVSVDFTGSSAAVTPSSAQVVLVNGPYTRYQFSTSLGPFGSGSTTSATSWSGDSFYASSFYVAVNQGFTSGGSINATATYAGHTLASLGIDVGAVTMTLPQDTITLIATAAPAADVPLPAAAPLLLGALGLIGVAGRRKG